MYIICFLFVFRYVCFSFCLAYGQTQSQAVSEISNLTHPKSIQHPADTLRIELLDFNNTDLRDVVRAIASKYSLNIFVEDGIENRVTLHLVDIPVIQALKFIASQYGLKLEREGSIFKYKRLPIPIPEPEPLAIIYKDNLLSLNLKNDDLQEVAKEISKKSGKNVVVNQGVQGKISGYLQHIPLRQGLNMLMNVNGFTIREIDGVLLVDRNNEPKGKNGSAKFGKSFWVSVKDSLITLDVTNANIKDVIRDIFSQIGMDVVIYEDVKGVFTARFTNITLDNALSYLLKGTNYTYHNENGMYMIGGKSLQGITSAKLIRLDYLKADEVFKLLPPGISKNATIEIIKEHNGFVIVGSQESIDEAMSFIREIDQPIPQVLIEAIVVDFNHTEIRELGIKAGFGVPSDTSNSIFNGLIPGINISASGTQLNSILDTYGGGIGLSRIAKLPDDFYFQLKAMEEKKMATIRSRPQIATLNGHTASISIGTTQYYKLTTATPISAPNQVLLQESERFETIKAEMLLEVTPWVTATGEIITEIHPQFSTPKSDLKSGLPPTIDHRVLDSTVKLKDGETIILGGLIQEFEDETVVKVPILSRIPILGKLFQSRSYKKFNSELIIYLTPHIYYAGDEINTSQGTIK